MMMTKVSVNACLAACVLFLFPFFARAEEAVISVWLRDLDGHVVNGIVTAWKESKTVKCQTKMGMCSVKNLEPGTWYVSARSHGGLVSSAQKVRVKADKKVDLQLRLTKPKPLSVIP